MPSVFTRIIDGELPARFVWKDDRCVAFLGHRPLRPGHTLVVPRLDVDHWVDLEPELLGHLMGVSHRIGQALQHGFHPLKVGMIIAGLEVPHVHVHLVPFHTWSSSTSPRRSQTRGLRRWTVRRQRSGRRWLRWVWPAGS